MEVTKVRRINEATTVEWTEPNGRHTTHSVLSDCPDQPEKDFLDQFATVEADLAAKIGFGKKFGERFTLTGVTMSRNRAGRRQFVPTAKVDWGWGEIGGTLPLLLEPDSEKPSGADNVLTEAELANIEQLFAEAARYAKGEREQTTLDLEEEGGEEEPADPFDPAAAAEAEHEAELAGAGAH